MIKEKVMKKIIHLLPLFIVSIFPSCNNKTTECLELWNKCTVYKNEVVSTETTTEIKGKHFTKLIYGQYEEGEVVNTVEENMTYDKHGNIATIDEIYTGHTVSTTYERDYDSRGLITWEKMTSMSTSKNATDKKTVEIIKCKYDDLKRPTENYREVYNNDRLKDSYYRNYTYDKTYSKCTEIDKKIYGDIKADVSIYNIETRFDKNGNPIETLGYSIMPHPYSNKSIVYQYFEYDKYNNCICTKKILPGSTLIVTTNTYHKNNPNKIEKTIEDKYEVGIAELREKSETTYTYDKYDRTTKIEKSIKKSDGEINTTRTEYEYNRVIRA